MSRYGYGAPGLPILPPAMPGMPGAGLTLPKELRRVGETTLWSTYYWPDGSALANRLDGVFQTPLNQVGQGWPSALTIAETNAREAGRVPGAQAYDVFALAVQPYYPNGFALDGADLRNLQAHCVILWSFLQTTIEVAPLQLVGAGGGIFGATADTGAVEGGLGGSRIALNNGNGQIWVYREYPVSLPANTTFAIMHQFGGLALPVDGGIGDSALASRVCMIGKFQSAIPAG